jgi:hypothetical protein
MATPFDDWKQRLFDSAGCASPSVRNLGDYVLELFWKDGCEPTVAALMDYAQAGLCGHVNVRVAAEALRVSPSRNCTSNEHNRSSPDHP